MAGVQVVRDRAGAVKHAAMALACVGALCLLSACSGARVDVQADFPVPLVRSYQLDVGWYLDEALTSYVHQETIDGSGEFVISLGDVQKQLFDRLSEGLFASHQFVGNTGPHPDLDGVMVPSITDLQFSTPKQTRSDYFEVWIRYEIKLYNTDGTLRGDWPLTAYGKAHTQNYGVSSARPALQEAAIAACRDAIAYFSLHFHTVPVVKTWLDERNARIDT